MNSVQELLVYCERFADRSIRSLPGNNGRSLIVDKAIGAIWVPIDASDGWRSDCTLAPSDATSWNLEKPYDELFANWQLAHPDEYSSMKIALSAFRSVREDGRTLELDFRRTAWSQVRAFQEAVERGTHERLTAPLMKYHFDIQHCPFPNIAVVHAIVVTSDAHIVATQRSQTMQYHPLTWSISLEEGLKEADFATNEDPVKVATTRGIAEELTGDNDLTLDEFTILSVAVEYPILNPAIVTFSKIDVDSATLTSHWSSLKAVSKEPEVVSLHFIPCASNEIAGFFSQGDQNFLRAKGPMEALHPTSRYRLLLSMLYRFGLEQTLSALKAQ